MNVEFLIVFTCNGLVFATIFYLVMMCEIPDVDRAALSRIWAKIDRTATKRLEIVSRCLASKVAPDPGALILVEGQERQSPSLGTTVNER